MKGKIYTFRTSCSRYKKHVREIKGKLHCCFFPFISQTYSPLFYHFPVRFFLLYRKQACSAPFHVFLLFLKQAECVFLLFPKQASFMSVSFFLLYPKQAYWGMVRIFLLFPKHLVVWGEKNPAVVGRRIVEVLWLGCWVKCTATIPGTRPFGKLRVRRTVAPYFNINYNTYHTRPGRKDSWWTSFQSTLLLRYSNC